MVRSRVRRGLGANASLLRGLNNGRTLLIFRGEVSLLRPIVRFISVRTYRFVSILIIGTRVRHFLIRTHTLTFKTSVNLNGLFHPLLNDNQHVLLLRRLGMLRGPLMNRGMIKEHVGRATLCLSALVQTVRCFICHVLQRVLSQHLSHGVVFLGRHLCLPRSRNVFVFAREHSNSFMGKGPPIKGRFIRVGRIRVPRPLAAKTDSLQEIRQRVVENKFFVERSNSKARRPLTMVTRLPNVNVVGRGRPLALLRNNNGALFRSFIILFQCGRLICRSFSVIILMAIRFRTICGLTRLTIRTSVRVTFLTRLLRGFFMVPLTNACRQNGRGCLLALVVPIGRTSSLFLNVFRRFLSQGVEVDGSYANVRRARVVMCLYHDPRNETKVLIYHFLFSKGCQTRSYGLVRVQTLRPSRRVANMYKGNLGMSPLPFNRSNVRYREQFATSTRSNCRHRTIP